MPDWLHLENELVLQIALAVLLSLAVGVLTRVSQRLAGRYITDPTRLYKTNRNIRRVGVTLILMLVLVLLFPGGDVVTLLTVIGAGLAIALREVLLSYVGWMRITFLTTYKQGDRIEVNGVFGDVIDIRLLRTTLMETRGWVDADQSTGRIAHIPNSWIFDHAVFNYSRGFSFIWNELPLTVTFRSDWRAARDILQQFAEESSVIVEQQAAKEIREMSREFLVHYSILTPFVYVRMVDHGIRLTLRYLCDVQKRRGTEHALTVSTLDAFKQHGGIELAYPTVGISTLTPPQFGPLPERPPAS